MGGSIIAIAVVAMPILGYLWTIHRDVAGLEERMARMEGLFEGLIIHTISANGSQLTDRSQPSQGNGG